MINNFENADKAIKIGDLKTFIDIIECEPDINICDPNGLTYLMLASMSPYTYYMENLYARGVNNINQKNKLGNTALIAASLCNNIETIKKLIEYGANVNDVNNDGGTALTHSQNIECITCLVEHGANVNHAANNNGTVLSKSVSSGNTASVQYLLNNGADVNHIVNDFTYLMVATICNRIDCIPILINHGVDIDYVNRSGKTVLDLTTNPEIKKLIIEYRNTNFVLK